eukprot:438364-Pyramimonas_sp.AAC.1
MFVPGKPVFSTRSWRSGARSRRRPSRQLSPCSRRPSATCRMRRRRFVTPRRGFSSSRGPEARGGDSGFA